MILHPIIHCYAKDHDWRLYARGSHIDTWRCTQCRATRDLNPKDVEQPYFGATSWDSQLPESVRTSWHPT